MQYTRASDSQMRVADRHGARVPGCQGARARGREGARVPGCQDARVARVALVKGALRGHATGATRNSTTLRSISKRIEHAGEGFFCTNHTIDNAPAWTKSKRAISKSRMS